jgi:hypothetical protein
MKLKDLLEGDVINFPSEIDELTGKPVLKKRRNEFIIMTHDNKAVATYPTEEEAKRNIKRLQLKLGRPLFIDQL